MYIYFIRKLEPVNIYNSIMELKKKVKCCDLNEKYGYLQEDLLLKTDSKTLNTKCLSRIR